MFSEEIIKWANNKLLDKNKNPLQHMKISGDDKEKIFNLTSFLSSDYKLAPRINLLIRGIDYNPKCKTCGNPVKWQHNEWMVFCSRKCIRYDHSHKNKITEKRKHTNKEKYGVEHVLQRQEILEKTKNTLLERYGVETAMESEYIRDKIKKSNLEKYGVEWAISSDIVRKKSLETIRKKYGVDNISYHPDIIEKIKRKQNESFAHIRKPIIDNLDKIIKMNETMNLGKIAKELNVSLSGMKTILKEYEYEIQVHFINSSEGELEVKSFIETLGFNVYKTCHTFNDKKKEIDILVDNKNFAIEYCGEYWHSADNVGIKYHQEKTLWCREQNINLMTIFEHEWLYKTDLIKSMIKSRLGLNERIFARKCSLINIDNLIAKEFHGKNHINGYINSKVNIGLIYKGILVGVLSLSKSRYDKNYDYEITRYSTLQGYTVVGGFSKLFKSLNLNSVITYADLRFGYGNVYSKNGFIFDKITKPNYWYFKKYNSDNLESRIKYQKHKLKKFDNYSDDKTEIEIMNGAGYLRIYDCGNVKYVLKK